LSDVAECPLPCAYAQGECDVLLRADDIVHDDEAPVKAEIIRKAFRGSEFLYTLRLASGETVLAHVPSHHNHTVGEWIGIRAEVDHVVTFNRACPPEKGGMCELPCAAACSEPCGDPARADGEHAVTLVRGAAARAPSTVGAAD
jgi:iron(III) transport system ATP-binding protein